MSTNEWIGPWKCNECGKAFKCQDLKGDCQSIGKAVQTGCRCVEHTLFRSLEDKLKQCRVVPFIREPHLRKGKLISGTELIQI